MENLKLTSIRLTKATLENVKQLSSSSVYYSSSDVLRLAIWLGLKILKPNVFNALNHLMWKEEFSNTDFTLEDVLRTAGGLKDEHKG